MEPALLADLVVVVHFGFVLFVVLGGLLALRWPWIGFIHVPAAVWGAVVEFMGWICPLTPLEVKLRRAAGADGYTGGFVEHYLIPLLYPQALDRPLQIVLGVVVVVVNILIYAFVLHRLRRRPHR